MSTEPLLSSKQSNNGLLVSEENRDFQSICLTYLSRIKDLLNQMSIRSPRTCCYETIKWIPVLFILGVVGWSYYAYVVQMCIFTVDSIPKKVGPTREFYIGDVEGERIAASQTADERRAALLRLSRQGNLPVLTRHFDGSIRYCLICRCIKPDRAHHCSVCEKCVLRYDHHCPWTNSCISYGNYKFFILFLGWALLLCIYVAATSFEYFLQFWQSVTNAQKDGSSSTPSGGQFHLLFLFFVSIMFGISVSSLFFYHLFLTGKNRTTVESFRAPIFVNGPQREGFNLGCQLNYREIFGTNIFKALIPISTTRGDGVHYQVNNLIMSGLQQQSGNSSYVTRSNNHTNQQNNIISPFNRSSDVLLPLDTPSNPTNPDRNYLLSGHTNSR